MWGLPRVLVTLLWQQLQTYIRPSRTGVLQIPAAFLTKSGWCLTKLAISENKYFLLLLKVAFSEFGLFGCVGARFGRGINLLPAYDPIHTGVCVYWHQDRPDEVGHIYDAGNVKVNLQQICEGYDINNICFCQLLCQVACFVEPLVFLWLFG